MAELVNNADKSSQSFDYNNASDESLFERYRFEGDSKCLEVIIHRYEAPLYNYLFRYLGNREAAEDVFQSTFLQVYTKHDQFDFSKRFKPWLYTVATNQAIDYRRRSNRKMAISLDASYSGEDSDSSSSLQDILESSEKDPLTKMDDQEQAKRVREAVEKLPPILRDTVNLIYFEDLKYKDAADILGIPVGTVKSRLHSAMIKLGEIFLEQNSQENVEEEE